MSQINQTQGLDETAMVGNRVTREVVFDHANDNTAALTVDGQTVALADNRVLNIDMDGAREMFFGRLFGFPGLIADDPTNVIFFATSLSQGFALNGASFAQVFLGDGGRVGNTFGSYNYELWPDRTDMTKDVAMRDNLLSFEPAMNMGFQHSGGLVEFKEGADVSMQLEGDKVVLNRGLDLNVTNTTATTYNVQREDHIISQSSVSGARNVVLPASAQVNGATFVVKDASGRAQPFAITVTDSGGALIDGAVNFVIGTRYQAVRFYWDTIQGQWLTI